MAAEPCIASSANQALKLTTPQPRISNEDSKQGKAVIFELCLKDARSLIGIVCNILIYPEFDSRNIEQINQRPKFIVNFLVSPRTKLNRSPISK